MYRAAAIPWREAGEANRYFNVGRNGLKFQYSKESLCFVFAAVQAVPLRNPRSPGYGEPNDCLRTYSDQDEPLEAGPDAV